MENYFLNKDQCILMFMLCVPFLFSLILHYLFSEKEELFKNEGIKLFLLFSFMILCLLRINGFF